ncbi:hypothetical protein PF008_g8447 [Phytophthora fragariae]|uniref:RxLR effector protein n=1 Tax=Phytophthora fragariae TaxID=53985 RepID=A0A6G0RZJ9_9STRA|nr:hypothetical protein PF008_g8447 [Phytophthora fragariae]
MRFFLLFFATLAASTFAFGGARDQKSITRALEQADDIATVPSALEHTEEFKRSLRHKHHRNDDDDDDDDDDD